MKIHDLIKQLEDMLLIYGDRTILTITDIESEYNIKEIKGKMCAKYFEPSDHVAEVTVIIKRNSSIKMLPSVTPEPEPCEDAVSREAIMKHYNDGELSHVYYLSRNNLLDYIESLPSVTPKAEPQWIPVTERLPEEYGNYLISIHGEDEPDIGTINPNDKRGWSLCDANGFHWASDKELIVTAWMPLPEPYRAERRTDE